MSGKSRYRGPRGGKSTPKPNPLFASGRVPAAPGNRPPSWMPPLGNPVTDDLMSHTMSYLTSQPQLIVCGLLGLNPLTDDERRELLASINLYDALETVARLQAQWDLSLIHI